MYLTLEKDAIASKMQVKVPNMSTKWKVKVPNIRDENQVAVTDGNLGIFLY